MALPYACRMSTSSEIAAWPGLPSIHISAPSASWNLLFQSAVRVRCSVNIPLSRLLREDFALTEDAIASVDSFLLDGMPVDLPEQALVTADCRLALAAGLPGIAGLALKSGSAVKAMRAGISHPGINADGTNAPMPPRPGTITLALYSLALPALAPHFLKRGIAVTVAQLLRYGRFAPDDQCRMNGRELPFSQLAELLPEISDRAAPNISPAPVTPQPEALFFLTAG